MRAIHSTESGPHWQQPCNLSTALKHSFSRTLSTQNTQLKKRIYQTISFFILDFIAKVVEKVCKCVKDTLYGILNQEEQTEKKPTEEQ